MAINYKRLQESLMDDIARDIEVLINEAAGSKFILNKSKIRTVEITSRRRLLELVANSGPDKEADRGFWLFDETFTKDRTYLEINEPPFYPHYIAYMYEETPVALFSFSMKYYKKYATEGEDARLKNYIRLLDFQTDSKYKGNGIQKFCLDRFCRIAAKYGYEGVTMMCYTPELCEKYRSEGFEGGQGLMWKTF